MRPQHRSWNSQLTVKQLVHNQSLIPAICTTWVDGSSPTHRPLATTRAEWGVWQSIPLPFNLCSQQPEGIKCWRKYWRHNSLTLNIGMYTFTEEEAKKNVAADEEKEGELQLL